MSNATDAAAKAVCSIDGCEKAAVRKGMCKMHETRVYRYGDPHFVKRPRRWETPCSVDGCDGKIEAKGYCVRHYARYQKHGDPLGGWDRYSTPEEALGSRFEQVGECKLWTGRLDDEGYGAVRVDGKDMLVHRFAWKRENGEIPDGLVIDHICFNRACIEPKHLRLATVAQNSWNREGAPPRSKLGVRNVVEVPNGYQVQIKKMGETHDFGTYSTIAEAAEVADRARQELFGEFAGGSSAAAMAAHLEKEIRG